jgi:hypothetical protein
MSSALYNICAVTVGVPVTGMPRSLRFRLLFLVFVWYCSAINTVFQTFLTSFLVDPGYENQLASLDEILDSGIEFGHLGYSKMFLGLSSDLRHKEVIEIGEVCWNIEECFDRIRETGNFAVFAPMWVVQYYPNTVNDHSTICLLNDDGYGFIFMASYFQKGSFFLESVNKCIFLSIESGMFGRAAKNSGYVPKPIRQNTDVSDGYFVFTLSHLGIAFYILFVGHGVSFLLFFFFFFFLRIVLPLRTQIHLIL